MLAKDAVSKQEADEKAGDLAAKTAITNAGSANVLRLQALQGFTRLTRSFLRRGDQPIDRRSASSSAPVPAARPRRCSPSPTYRACASTSACRRPIRRRSIEGMHAT
jgi:hypothetical protein